MRRRPRGGPYGSPYGTVIRATPTARRGSPPPWFEAGRLGEYTIEKDPTRDAGLRILMGPFTVYDKSNVEEG
jgi:rhamnose transport system substrate-binding protein